MGFGGSPQVAPLPAAPPPPPQVQQPAESAAASQAEQSASTKAGAASTIQTGGQGVTKRSTLGTSSLIGD